MIIAAVRNAQELDAALHSRVKMIFWLSPNILTLAETVRSVHEAGKKIFIHMDLAEGLGKDKPGLQFAGKAGVDGVISTRVNIIIVTNTPKRTLSILVLRIKFSRLLMRLLKRTIILKILSSLKYLKRLT